MPAFPEPFTCGHMVYSSAGSDGFGNPVDAWATAVSRNVYGAYPGTAAEDYEPGRNPSTVPMFLMGSTAQLGTVRARDRIVWQSATFEVDGEPESYDFGPFGFTPGVRVRLVRVEG